MEPSQGGTFKASWEYFAQESIIPGIKDHCLVKVQHMIIQIRGVVVHSKRWNDKSARRLIVQNMLAQGGRQHVIRPPDRWIKCCTQGGGGAPNWYCSGENWGAMPPNQANMYSGANSDWGLSLLASLRVRRCVTLIARLDWRGGLFLDSASALF